MFRLMYISYFGKLIVSFMSYLILPFICICILITSKSQRTYLIYPLFWWVTYFLSTVETTANLQKRRCISCPIIRRFVSFLHSASYYWYIVRKHVLPKISILNSKFLGNLKAQSKIEDNELVLLVILRMRPYKNITWMRIAMNKSRNKDLLGECSN